MFVVELPIVEPEMTVRDAFFRLRKSGKSGLVVRHANRGDLVLSADIVRGLHEGRERPMRWCVDEISRHHKWHAAEFADYFLPRLEAYASVFGDAEISFPPTHVRGGLSAGRAYRIAGVSGGAARLITPHRWMQSGLGIRAMGCVCTPGGCTFSIGEVADKAPCPMGDGTITCS
ncbi:MAG: hypothetical protein JOY64_36190 [Alphaproteobacteria bacterium]|nr:hypothetical protein [Alphaproteobacteria bacterium]MBV8413111.1 hypothetical protein [Alphaproteobacteria bacterium]